MKELSAYIRSGTAHFTYKDWEGLIKAARIYAVSKYSTSGLDLEAIGQEAILALLTGKRSPPPLDKKGRISLNSMKIFACNIVRSIASHELIRRARETSIEETFENPTSPPDPLNKGDDQSYTLPPEINALDQAISNQVRENILHLLEGDRVAQGMVRLIMEDPQLKPGDLADMLKIPVEEIQNAKKRIIRRIQSLREERRDVKAK